MPRMQVAKYIKNPTEFLNNALSNIYTQNSDDD